MVIASLIPSKVGCCSIVAGHVDIVEMCVRTKTQVIVALKRHLRAAMGKIFLFPR